MQSKQPLAELRVLASILVLCLLGSSSIGADQSARSAIRAPSGTTVEILSIPSGLKIYLAPDTGQSPKPEGGWTPAVGSHPVVSDGFLKGVTPLVLRGLDPGKYLLGVSPTILIRNSVFQPSDPLLDARAFVSTKFSTFPLQLEGDLKGAVVYSVTVEQRGRTRVIVLAVPWDASTEELAVFYPPRATFVVDEAKFGDELKQRSPEMYANFSSEANVRAMVDLLRRGGKAWLHVGDLGVVAAIRADGGTDFAFEVRLEGVWRPVSP